MVSLLFSFLCIRKYEISIMHATKIDDELMRDSTIRSLKDDDDDSLRKRIDR